MQRQARAPETQRFGVEAFEASGGTVLRWLGMAGFLINSRGTTVMIDPLLGGFDMPVMIEFPIAADDVPKLDAVLVTHSDNDHRQQVSCSGGIARRVGRPGRLAGPPGRRRRQGASDGSGARAGVMSPRSLAHRASIHALSGCHLRRRCRKGYRHPVGITNIM
jgi:hypothetical protein